VQAIQDEKRVKPSLETVHQSGPVWMTKIQTAAMHIPLRFTYDWCLRYPETLVGRGSAARLV